MQNAAGQIVDVYIPRKCAASNRIIGPKDHASVQLTLAHLNESGIMTGKASTFAFSGHVRASGNGDSKINEVMRENGFMPQH
ncbi:40S ribosomal protein S21 [Carpediemonas membranifera]|uniref:40S ribosomal protein S21 n=1 Tax=Carpediemonas membranifera TaxID=201153 RepID=A0A8J6BY49_9EUKA|nr:40S ribosomal protein S21 [Carpediemonas membranifera]|eukprot:KAG9394131.1 40S ribosomal protein S21 [Carpediemonas membranifera]